MDVVPFSDILKLPSKTFLERVDFRRLDPKIIDWTLVGSNIEEIVEVI